MEDIVGMFGVVLEGSKTEQCTLMVVRLRLGINLCTAGGMGQPRGYTLGVPQPCGLGYVIELEMLEMYV
jgi:hypothetical protein